MRRSFRTFVICYLSACAGLFLLIAALMMVNGVPTSRVAQLLPRIAVSLARSVYTWLLLLVPWLLFLLARSLVRIYRTRGWRPFAAALALRAGLPVFVAAAGFQGLAWYRYDPDVSYPADPSVENRQRHTRGLYEIDGKQRGVNLVADRRFREEQILPLLRNNIEWVTLVPYGFQRNVGRPGLRMRTAGDRYWSETDEGIKNIAAVARPRGVHLMLKPQLWISRGGEGVWISNIQMQSEGDWKLWFEDYRKFILHYASLAAALDVEVLCIGTELHQTAKQRPADWRALISEVRSVYKGKLTYASNWMGETGDVDFWDALDFIGVQAFFPLSSKESPSLEECIAGWQRHLPELEKISARYRKPVLFTEIGFKSTGDAAIRPWEWPDRLRYRFKKVSTRTQANCYESFFRVVWSRSWFAGAHVWKWYADHDRAGGREDVDFTPQNKPAQNVIQRGFGPIRP